MVSGWGLYFYTVVHQRCVIVCFIKCFTFSSCPQIKLAFFVAIVGVVLTVLGVGTEFWVELAPPKNFYNNQVKPPCMPARATPI